MAVEKSIPPAIATGMTPLTEKINSIEEKLRKIDSVEKKLVDALALKSEVDNIKKETATLRNFTLPRLVEHLNETVT